MPVLEYTGGKSPWDNIEAFVAKVKKKYPGISELGIQQVVKRALGTYDARLDNGARVITLFGRDIMTAHPEELPVWPILAQSHRERVIAHPYDTGETVNPENPKVSQLELIGRLDHHSINRSVLVSPEELESTYVWSSLVGWTQEVTPKDYDLILSIQSLSRLFQDPDIHGPYVTMQAYAPIQVRERHIATNADDVKALVREFTPKKLFGGVTVEETR